MHGTIGTAAETESALKHIIDVGTSAGGARAKAVVNINQHTGEIRAGHVLPPAGFNAWLLNSTESARTANWVSRSRMAERSERMH